MKRLFISLVALLLATPLYAQNTPNQAPGPNQAQLRLVIVDETGAGIPTADVVITPKSGGAPVAFKSDDRGLATSPNIAPGDVTVHVEFPGFLPFDAPLNLRRGAQNQVVTLRIEGFKQEVAVSETTGPEAARSTSGFSLTQAEIDALPDDPEELAEVLSQIAGPGGATFFMNGFQGGRLPTRDQIRSIRFRQNNYAADNHDAGRTQIDIVTRPNTNWAGNVNTNLGGDALNARPPQAITEQPQQERQVQFGLRGPIKSGTTSFNLNVNGNNRTVTNPIIALDSSGNRIDDSAQTTNDQTGLQIGIEHSLTANHGLYFNFQRNVTESLNNGVGQFTLPERGTNRTNDSNQLRLRLQGIIGGSKLLEFRVQTTQTGSETYSITEGPSINVQDAFNEGGAGVRTDTSNRRVEFAHNFDFNVGTKHQMRAGILVDVARYENFDERNRAGTWTYRTINDYNAGRPQQFTQRVGTLDTSFSQYQMGIYWSDEFRLHRDVTLGVGVRNEFQSRIDDKLNLMPRVGFSWAPFGSQRSAVRGGYGVFYDWYEANLYDQTLRVNGVTTKDIRITCSDVNEYCDNGAFSFDPLAPGDVLITPSGRIQASPDLSMARVHQASISYDRQLTALVVLQTSYQMMRGRHTMRSININAPVNGVRPNPEFGDITQFESTGETQSDRLTVSTQFRFQSWQQQLGMRFSYTLGQEKNFANGATSLPSDNLNPDVDWGPANGDIRHQFQVQGQVPMPYGIRTQVNLTVRSGVPYNMTTGFDDNNDGAFNDRPFSVTRNSLRGDWTRGFNVNVNKRFNIGVRTAGTPGRNVGNNGGALFAQQGGGGGFGGGGGGQGGGQGFGGPRGQGGNQNNSSRFSVELFGRADNVFNRVTRTGYTGNLSSPYFGQATGVGAPREITVGMRFNF